MPRTKFEPFSATIDTYIAPLARPFATIATQLHVLLDGRLGAERGVIWHGHPVWKDGRQPLAGFKAYGSYVTFMLWNGTDIDDPESRLTLGANGMGTIKLREPGEIDAAVFGAWLDQVKS